MNAATVSSAKDKEGTCGNDLNQGDLKAPKARETALSRWENEGGSGIEGDQNPASDSRDQATPADN